jgi:UDP-N-acetylmuramoyl-tripeptide--D-alanyl-D-alanine ligase
MQALGCVEIVSAIGGRPGRRVEIAGVSTDSRTTQPGDLFFALHGDAFDGHDFVKVAFARGAAAAVVSRTVEDLPPDAYCIMVEDTTKALGDLANRARRAWNGKVIAVTGSNGKTTTKEMIYQLLSGSHRVRKAPKSFNNNIGVPLTIFSIEPQDEFGVIEMGTNAPGEIARLAEIAEPDIAVVTNVMQTHLEGLRSLSGVAAAKAELLAGLKAGGLAVINADNEHCRKMIRNCRARVLTFGVGSGAQARATSMQPLAWGTRFRLNGSEFEVPVPGIHNVMNALAALAVCRELGLQADDLAARLAAFEPPPMRLARREAGGVMLINDAYNANPGSMQAALQVFGSLPVNGRRIMVCGEMLELGKNSRKLHEQLGKSIAEAGVNEVWTVGEASKYVAEAIRSTGQHVAVNEARQPLEAAAKMLRTLEPGDAVLLKGSRGVKLETLMDALVAGLDGDASVALAGK